MVAALRFFSVRIALVAVSFVGPIATVTHLQVSELNHAASVVGIERNGVACLRGAYAVLDALDMPAPATAGATTAASTAFTNFAADNCFEKADFARLSRRNVRNASARLTLALAVDALINNIGERYLWYDSSPITAHASDSSAYALADSLPELGFAAAATDRIAAAKFEATAASRLAIVDYDVAALIEAAPWTGSYLRIPHARQKASLKTYFRMLDHWERRIASPHPDLTVPLRASFEASDQLLAAFTQILNRNFSRELAELDYHRRLVTIGSTILLAVALAVAAFIARAVTRRQQREIARLKDIALTEARFLALFAESPLAIAITDRNGILVEFNAAYVALVGASVLQTGSTPVLHAATPAGPLGISLLFDSLLGQAQRTVTMEIMLARYGAPPVVCDATATLVRTPGNDAAYCALLLQDITERQLRVQRLQYEATHDALTGIGNRAALLDALQGRLARQDAAPPRFALMFIDVDDFKSVNDTLGHAAGDTCLIAIAKRLASLVRSDDVVARYGGDEFAILFCDDASIEHVDTIASRIRREFELPIGLGDSVLVISSSIGVTIDEGDDDDAQGVIACADRAMYIDKARAVKRAASIRRRVS